jgi:anti-sigma factor RsiW
MKTDTQHLEYLISQYVDGCLDATNKKSLEQRLLNDPSARALYKEQHDVQDVLDDWGNRIPLINWDEFDQQLGRRLENETVGGRTRSIFRRWGRPMSIAAALMVAATLGYSWHAWSAGPKNGPAFVNGQEHSHELPNRGAVVEPEVASTDGSVTKFRVDEQPNTPSALSASAVNITPPGNADAADSLKLGVGYGMTNLSDVARSDVSQPGASSGNVAQGPANSALPKKDENPIPPAMQ